jgi:DNA polymerase-3 subunit gamma/tau
MLTREAFNALLKTLEEPPEYVKFILATTDPMKLPPTILSRTQHFRFKRINQPEVVKHLSHILNLENIEYEPEALSMLTRAGNGSLRDTLTLLDQSIIFSKNYVDAKSVASMLGILDPEFIDNIFTSIFQNNRDELIGYIKELENYESEIVIDEIISFVKDRFFEKDARFSTMISDRFFNILSKSKNLLFLNADSSFVLTLLFFKMVEATKIKDINEMIESLESSTKIQKQPITQQQKPEAVQQQVQQALNQQPIQQESATQQPTQEEKPQNSNFKNLIDKLYDRNYDLGECFKNSIEFISFENDKVNLVSCAEEECKKTLRQSSGIIKHFVQECFGFEAKIAMKACDKPKQEQKKNDIKEEIKPPKQEPIKENPDSCISNHTVSSSNEIDRDNIMENEFVKRAQELFEPQKIIVKSKV